MRSSIRSALAAALVLWSASADAQSACTPSALSAASVRIDANSGRVTGGSTRFPEGEALKVIVAGKNPFKYEYRIEVTAQPLNEAIAVDFFAGIPGFSFGDLLAPSVSGPAPGAPKCLRVDAEWQALTAEVEKGKRLKGALEGRKKVADDYNAFLKRTDVESLSEAVCTDVLKEATALQGALPQVIDLGTLPNDVAQYAKSAPAALAAFEAAFKMVSETDRMACEMNLGTELVNARKVTAHADTLSKGVQTLASNRSSFQTMQTLFGVVLKSPTAFHEEHFPPTQDEPTGVRVVIARKNRRIENAAEQQVTSIPIQVGRSRLSIAAGLAFSGVPHRRIVRQAGQIQVPAVAATATTPAVPASTRSGTVFAYAENSEFGPRPVIALNADIYEFSLGSLRQVAAGFTTAVVIGAANDSLRTEYLVGPSIGVLQNRVVFTGGVHFARVENLGGGFEIGQEIPPSLQDPLPIRRDWEKALAFAVTYRVR